MWSGRPTADLHDQGGVGEHGSCDIVGESNAFALSKPTASHAIHVSTVVTRYRSCDAQHGSHARLTTAREYEAGAAHLDRKALVGHVEPAVGLHSSLHFVRGRLRMGTAAMTGRVRAGT
jgi:hypothetical protein